MPRTEQIPEQLFTLFLWNWKQLNCCAPVFATSFYLAPKIIYNEMLLCDTPQPHAEDRIFISAINKHSL